METPWDFGRCPSRRISIFFLHDIYIHTSVIVRICICMYVFITFHVPLYLLSIYRIRPSILVFFVDCFKHAMSIHDDPLRSLVSHRCQTNGWTFLMVESQPERGETMRNMNGADRGVSENSGKTPQIIPF